MPRPNLHTSGDRGICAAGTEDGKRQAQCLGDSTLLLAVLRHDALAGERTDKDMLLVGARRNATVHNELMYRKSSVCQVRCCPMADLVHAAWSMGQLPRKDDEVGRPRGSGSNPISVCGIQVVKKCWRGPEGGGRMDWELPGIEVGECREAGGSQPVLAFCQAGPKTVTYIIIPTRRNRSSHFPV